MGGPSRTLALLPTFSLGRLSLLAALLTAAWPAVAIWLGRKKRALRGS